MHENNESPAHEHAAKREDLEPPEQHVLGEKLHEHQHYSNAAHNAPEPNCYDHAFVNNQVARQVVHNEAAKDKGDQNQELADVTHRGHIDERTVLVFQRWGESQCHPAHPGQQQRQGGPAQIDFVAHVRRQDICGTVRQPTPPSRTEQTP